MTHLLGTTVNRLKAEGNVAGSVLENLVVMEPRKRCTWSATRPQLFYWRTVSGREVDIVLEDRTVWRRRFSRGIASLLQQKW